MAQHATLCHIAPFRASHATPSQLPQSLEVPKGSASGNRLAHGRGSRSGKSLGALVATVGNTWNAMAQGLSFPFRSSLGCPPSTVRWPQQALIHAFQQLFPDDFFVGFIFPYIEDSVNAPPFTTYSGWCDSWGFPPGAPQPPLLISKCVARKARAGEGVQLGAFLIGPLCVR